MKDPDDLLSSGSTVTDPGWPGTRRLVRRSSGLFVAVRQRPDIGLLFGVVLSLSGLALIAVAWGRTARLSNVALQTPHVLSYAFTGIGLIVLGVTTVSICAKLMDAGERSRQLQELHDLLALRAQGNTEP